MEKLGKKELLLRLYKESQDFMNDLEQDLTSEIDFDESEIQENLYLGAIILRDLMVVIKKLRERHDEGYRSEE
ncbi:MAG: hypothetical protein R6U96_16060 [Promethearchaeia archaeon]